jgi:hypothetical protein
MAYTKTPAQDTYQTKQIPLIYEWENRSTSVDGALDAKQTIAQNVYFDPVDNKTTGEGYYHVRKRDGTVRFKTLLGGGGGILGMYFWERTGEIIAVTPSDIYRINPESGVAASTVTADFADATVEGVGFTEFLFENGDVHLVISSNTTTGTMNAAGTWTKIVDPDVPVNRYSFPVFLDGYLFILGFDGNIYNSDLNDPLTWNASNFISVESYPDLTRAIARVGSYIVALGTSSTEWFYDAGNPTGTPLARVDGATQEIGFLQGLVASNNELYFVGRASKATPSVYRINGLKITEVGNATNRRWLTTSSDANGGKGYIFSMGGHRFYVVVQNRDTTSPIQTYMLDLDTNMWSSIKLRTSTEGPFVFGSATALRRYGGFARAVSVMTYFSEYNSNIIWMFDPETGQDQQSDDSYVNYTCEFVTRPLDFSNYRLKFCGRLVFGTDQAPATSLMYASWSDDDMQTFSTPRAFDVSKPYTPLWACGAFRKRAFKLTYADTYSMRWRSVEIDYNQGQA